MKINERKRKELVKKNPAKIFLVAYIVAILIGAFLLVLPISSTSGQFTNPLDAIFTATSAVCVTGLVTFVTASYWTWFGKLVIILLIQLGGLGVVTAATAVGLIINKKFSLKDRMYIAEEKNSASLSGMIKLIKFVLLATLIIEAVGALLLAVQFVPEFGLSKGILYSIFHSISAFCNAGFDIIGPSSLVPYKSNPIVIITVSLLIVLGGIGFFVYRDIMNSKSLKRLHLHTKLVLIGTFSLIFIPALLFLIVEWNNPDTIGNLSITGKVLSAIFQSVTTRTAGFFSIDQAAIYPFTLIFTIVLMFIGGAPAGTAGGLKITTFLTMFFSARSNIIKDEDVTVFKRRIPRDTVEKSYTIFFISIVWLFVAILLLSFSDGNKSLADLIYELVSAYGTVGLTRGITQDLSVVGKWIIIVTMIFGKIGPLSMVYVFTQRTSQNIYKEAEENILVG